MVLELKLEVTGLSKATIYEFILVEFIRRYDIHGSTSRSEKIDLHLTRKEFEAMNLKLGDILTFKCDK